MSKLLTIQEPDLSSKPEKLKRGKKMAKLREDEVKQ